MNFEFFHKHSIFCLLLCFYGISKCHHAQKKNLLSHRAEYLWHKRPAPKGNWDEHNIEMVRIKPTDVFYLHYMITLHRTLERCLFQNSKYGTWYNN